MLTARRDSPTKLGKQERTAKNNRGRAMADETATLAAYVANLKFEDIPREVLERAKVLTLDFLGSAIRARRDAESTSSLLQMLEALALDGKGESTVFGDAKAWRAENLSPFGALSRVQFSIPRLGGTWSFSGQIKARSRRSAKCATWNLSSRRCLP